MKPIAVALALLLAVSPLAAPRARAEADTQTAFAIVAVIAAAFLITSWRMDNPKDDGFAAHPLRETDGLQVVLCAPPASGEPGSLTAGAGVGLFAAF